MKKDESVSTNKKLVGGNDNNVKTDPVQEMQGDRDTTITKTAVTAWLKKNGAGEYIDEFYKQGYFTVESVDDNAIEEIVKGKRGIANTLKNSLTVYKERASGQPMAPPKLPAGTQLDLSSLELKSPDGISFSVDKSLSVESTNAAIISPNNIKPEEWIIIARSANLLYGYDMDSNEPKWAKTPILDWKVPERDDFARSEITHAKVTSELTYSDEIATFVSSGFDTETATAAYTFCAASVERNHKYKEAKSSQTKTLFQVGMWKYPRAQIYLDKCTITSDRFISAVKSALKSDDKYNELTKVFHEYGHIIPSSVLLGGQLCFKASKESSSFAEEQKLATDYKAALDIKLGKVSASTGFAQGSETDKKSENLTLDEFESFTNRGGDSLLCTNPSQWAPTVKDPANWAVIEMEGMQPTIDLLENDLKQQVLEVWNNEMAILNPIEIEPLKESEGAEYPLNDNLKKKMQNGGFAVAMRRCGDHSRGFVELQSEQNKIKLTGAAYAHYASDDHWIEYNSICMPVACGGSFRTKYGGGGTIFNLSTRLLFVPSNLRFGIWEEIKEIDGLNLIKPNDGFLFVSIRASQQGCQAGVIGLVNEEEIAGGFVHWDEKNNEYFESQNFCIPVPADSTFCIRHADIVGHEPEIHAYWIPLRDERWKMQERIKIDMNTLRWAETNGVLHGWIRGKVNGDRDTLKIYQGEDEVSLKYEQQPTVASSMHWQDKTVRYLKYSSVMLPITKGTLYRAECKTSRSNLYWTAFEHR